MMHTLRNCKTGRKSAGQRFTEARRTSQTAVYPHLAGELQHPIVITVTSAPCCEGQQADLAERAQAGAQRADDGIAAVQTEWPFALTAC